MGGGITTWQRAATEAEEKFCLERLPDGTLGYELLHDIRAKLRADFYPREIVDFTMQHGWRHAYSLVDTFCFMRVWSAYLTGGLCFFVVPVGSCPDNDECLEENTSALKKLTDFKTFVHNAPQDDDGHLEWTDFDLGCVRLTDRGAEKVHIWLAPRRVPLEIGSTLASRTMGHLIENQGVARWPYESDQIVVGVTCRCCPGLRHDERKEPKFS